MHRKKTKTMHTKVLLRSFFQEADRTDLFIIQPIFVGYLLYFRDCSNFQTYSSEQVRLSPYSYNLHYGKWRHNKTERKRERE